MKDREAEQIAEECIEYVPYSGQMRGENGSCVRIYSHSNVKQAIKDGIHKGIKVCQQKEPIIKNEKCKFTVLVTMEITPKQTL